MMVIVIIVCYSCYSYQYDYYPVFTVITVILKNAPRLRIRAAMASKGLPLPPLDLATVARASEPCGRLLLWMPPGCCAAAGTPLYKILDLIVCIYIYMYIFVYLCSSFKGVSGGYKAGLELILIRTVWLFL